MAETGAVKVLTRAEAAKVAKAGLARTHDQGQSAGTGAALTPQLQHHLPTQPVWEDCDDQFPTYH